MPKIEEDGKSWLRRPKLYKGVVEPYKKRRRRSFWNTLFHLHRWVGMKKYLPAYEDGTDGVFRNVGI